jgi:hypothetical protein
MRSKKAVGGRDIGELSICVKYLRQVFASSICVNHFAQFIKRTNLAYAESGVGERVRILLERTWSITPNQSIQGFFWVW